MKRQKQTLLTFAKKSTSELIDDNSISGPSGGSLIDNDDEEDQSDPGEEEENSDRQDIEMNVESECTAQCCNANREKANQPTSIKILTKTKRMQGEGKSKQGRVVKASWFKQYPWLSLCETRSKLFCFYCSIAEHRGLMTFSTKADAAFSKEGFCNWKKGLQRFTTHESSQAHSEACMKLKSSVNIGGILDRAHKEQQQTRQRMLLKQLSSLKYLVRQGLAIRGHDEGEGNLIQLLKLRCDDDRELQLWLTEGRYLSPVIVNEQLKLMANQLLRSLLSDVKSVSWFSIMADEATDISHNEQMGVAIRWVSSSYEIQEEPIGLIQVPKTDSETLTSALKDVLIRCVLPLSQCRGQAYDGAANMAGHVSGVAARIKSEQPSALHVHCLAHCLNLCLQDASRTCTIVRDTLDIVTELAKLIRNSAKRSSLFESIKSQMSPDTSNLRPLCPTRWTVRTGAIGAVLANYSTVCSVLDEVHETENDTCAVKAGGLLVQLEKFSTFFGLKFCFLVFSASEQLSITLQGKDTTIQEAKGAAQLTMAFLERQRTESAYDAFYDRVVEQCHDLTDEPVLPRRRNPPRRTANEAECYQPETPKDYYRQKYFEVLDVVSNEISRRFNQSDLTTVADIEKMLLAAANGQEFTIPESVRTMYKEDLQMIRLPIHLQMLSDIIKRYGELTGIPVKQVTNIRTICQSMQEVPGAKDLCTEVHRLIQLFLTIPVTTATSERTFSAMRRLKNYLRSSMTQERLNHVLLLHCHKSRTDNINLNSVASNFIAVNERREQFFGKT